MPMNEASWKTQLSPYLRDMLARHGLEDSVCLADALPDWNETDLRDAFWPACKALAGNMALLENSTSPDGGEKVLSIDGQPALVSEDIWSFQAWAGRELMDRIAQAMQQVTR